MYFVTIVIVYIIQGIVFGFISRYLANSKGYDGGFAWGFWLGIIGVLVVGLRPSINTSENATEYKPMYPQAQSKSKTQWECGCGAKNPDTLDYCLSCRSARGTNKPIEKINCPYCGASNRITNTLCFACSKPLKTVDDTKAETAKETENSSNDFAATLEKLAKLHERGVLTDEEFQQKKADILAKM